MPSANLPTSTIDGTDPQNFSMADYDQTLAFDAVDLSGLTVMFGGVGIYRSTDRRRRLDVRRAKRRCFIPISMRSRRIRSIRAIFFAGNDGGLYSYNSSSGTGPH